MSNAPNPIAGLVIAVAPGSVRGLPRDGVMFCDLLAAGSIELAPARHSGGNNPVVTAVAGAIQAACEIKTLPPSSAT